GSSTSSGRPRRRSRRTPGAPTCLRTRVRLPIGFIPGCAAIARKPNLRIDGGEVRPSPTQLWGSGPSSPAVRERVPSAARRVRLPCKASARLVGFAGLILLLLAASAPAIAEDFAALVGGLAGDGFSEKERAVAALGALGDPRAIVILQALADGRLFKGD